VAALAWSWTDLGQLLLAVACGFVIGLEREISHKPAGVKTITLATLCGALLMQLGFKLTEAGMGGDPARLAAAAVSGIGFLGAGVILRMGRHVEGITTAATIWLMTAVGLAVGAGYYVPALVVVGLTLLGFLADPWLDRFTRYWRQRRRAARPRVTEAPVKDADGGFEV
jgi:putative Mg2+ transporter-C (MgtC) family protein